MIKKQLVSSYKKIVFNLSARNSILFKFFYRYLYKPSKGSLSYFYDKLSRQMKSIFVVQVGANDGINHDPIHKFIKRDGWSGVLIEPQPDVFRHKLFPLYRRNKGIHLENIALCNEVGLMDMYRLSFCAERWATGLTTFHLKTLKDKVDSGSIATTARNNGVEPPQNKEDFIEKIKVETKSFPFLFEKYNIKQVDVLQIDAEGYDFEIIKMFNVAKHQPKVVVFETDHINATTYKEIENYFTANNYLCKRVARDTLAVNKNFKIGVDLFHNL